MRSEWDPYADPPAAYDYLLYHDTLEFPGGTNWRRWMHATLDDDASTHAEKRFIGYHAYVFAQQLKCQTLLQQVVAVLTKKIRELNEGLVAITEEVEAHYAQYNAAWARHDAAYNNGDLLPYPNREGDDDTISTHLSEMQRLSQKRNALREDNATAQVPLRVMQVELRELGKRWQYESIWSERVTRLAQGTEAYKVVDASTASPPRATKRARLCTPTHPEASAPGEPPAAPPAQTPGPSGPAPAV